MKIKTSATQIILRDLPDEGRDFEFTRQTAELNAVLKDLIDDNDYHVRLHIARMGNTYDVKGELRTALTLPCSLCSDSFRYPVNLKINELLIVEKALGKNEQASKVNHAHELDTSAPDYVLLDTDVFNVAEYVHEAIGLAEPIRPLCAPEMPEGCRHPEHIDRPWLSYGDQKPGGDIRVNPFQLLEKLKLKS